eukprot:9609041-Alexandrium_andersonii.AAC.1
MCIRDSREAWRGPPPDGLEFGREPPPDGRHPREKLGRPTQAHTRDCPRGEAPCRCAALSRASWAP